MRKVVDEVGMRCYSTHTDQEYLSAKNLPWTRDLNLILGSKYVVLAWSDPKTGVDGWKALADQLNSVAEQLEPAGLKVGYHNHQAEFTVSGGERPMEILAKQKKPSVMLQLDGGTWLQAGCYPVGTARAHP